MGTISFFPTFIQRKTRTAAAFRRNELHTIEDYNLFQMSFFRSGHCINFHDIHKFEEIVLSHSMAPLQTGSLCGVSPNGSILLCEDLLESGKVRWLDCSVSPPKICEEFKAIESQKEIWDMCCVENNGKKLVVMLTWSCKLYAFDSESGHLEWRDRDHVVSEDGNSLRITKLTTDGLGHLFVYDHDQKCVLRLNAEGHYLNTVLDQKQIRESLGLEEEHKFKVKSVRFIRAIPVIVLACKSEGKYQICLIKI